MRKMILMSMVVFLTQSCASYRFAQKVKTISFDGDFKKGKSVGTIRGEDCTWTVLGYKLGGDPTLDKAFINANKQAGALASAGFKQAEGKNALRYVNNVHTEAEGFNAYLFGKNCIVLTGVGYR